jgi:hypothetical protein
MERHNWYQI